MASGSNVDFRTLLDRYHGMDLNAVCDEMTTDNTVQHSRDAPKPPTDEEKAAIKRLKICYNTLQLEPSEHRQLALLRLLRAWLLRHCRTHRLPLFSGNIYMDTLLDDTSLAFLMVFGQRLWPIANTDNINRKHLVPAATHVFERLCFFDMPSVEQAELAPGRYLHWYGSMFSGVPMRKAVRMYVETVDKIKYLAGEEELVPDLDELFSDVVR